jgi:hypothetical protein
MKYHPNLQPARLRAMPWYRQLAMVDSELSRACNLLKQGGGAEVSGCLMRARELMGVLESQPVIPEEHGIRLLEVTRSMAHPEFGRDSGGIHGIHETLSSIYMPLIAG